MVPELPVECVLDAFRADARRLSYRHLGCGKRSLQTELGIRTRVWLQVDLPRPATAESGRPEHDHIWVVAVGVGRLHDPPVGGGGTGQQVRVDSTVGTTVRTRHPVCRATPCPRERRPHNSSGYRTYRTLTSAKEQRSPHWCQRIQTDDGQIKCQFSSY